MADMVWEHIRSEDSTCELVNVVNIGRGEREKRGVIFNIYLLYI